MVLICYGVPGGRSPNQRFMRIMDGLIWSTNRNMDRSLFGSLLNTVPHAIFWKDKHLVFQGCNKQFSQQFGYENPEDIIGKTDYDFPFPKHLIDLYHRDDLAIIQTGVPKLNYEEVQTQADGSQKIVLLSKVPFLNEQQEIIGLLGIYSDITDRKKNETLLQKAKENAEAANQAKTEFLENMRHDIRTPLTGIVGFADIIKNETRDPKIKAYANSLVASSHALLRLLDEVLDSIRINAGEIPLLKKKFSLQHVLADVIQLNLPKAEQKHLALELFMDPTIPTYVLGDKTRVHRIVLELVANALNFTQEGHIHIRATLAKTEDKKLIIKLIVQDTGIGIDKEAQQDIYLQFKRICPAYRGHYQGMGLGLSVIKQFVEDLEGEIYVESALNQGTTFTCLFPLTAALTTDDEGVCYEPVVVPHYLEKDLAQPKLKTEATQKHHRVLLVEDNMVAQAVAQAILSSFSCEVDIASDCRQTLLYLTKNTYDLIFLDIGLSDGDGLLLAQEIKALLKNQGQIIPPMIALTAHIGEEKRQQCYLSGINAVVSKPFTQERAQSILQAYLPSLEMLYKPYIDELDITAVLDIQEGLRNTHQEEMLAKLLRLLIEQSIPQETLNLKIAYAQKDWDSIQKIIHKIKGGAVYTGTLKLHKACGVFEILIRQPKKEECEAMYHKFLNILSETTSSTLLWLANQATLMA